MKSAFPFRLYWDKILPDLLVVFLYSFLLDPLMNWQQTHPGLSCYLLMLLNIAAMGFGTYSFFVLYTDERKLTNYAKAVAGKEGALLAISILLSAIGFCWWLVPFAGMKKLGVQNTGFFIGMMVYFIGFLTIVSNTVNEKNQTAVLSARWLRMGSFISTTLFFFFSYVFLLMSRQAVPQSSPLQDVFSVLALILFYLPLRIFLLLRPPRHRVEYMVAALSFVYMLWLLFRGTY